MSSIISLASEDHTNVATVISEQTFVGQTFSHTKKDVVYVNCVFRDTRWIDLSLQHVRFINCNFENMFCAGIHTLDVQWDGCEMRDLDWQKVDLQQSHFVKCDVANWHLEFSKLTHLGLTKNQVSNWYMTDCQLQHVTLMDCIIQRFTQIANFASDMSWIDSKITDVGLERCRLDRFIAAQAWLTRLSVMGCSGSQVRTSQTHVVSAIIRDNNMSGSSWSHSELNDCQFLNNKLSLAGFDHATLTGVRFEYVQMPRAMFDSATAQAVQFNHVQMSNASLRGAYLTDVTFRQTDLSELDARGLRSDGMTFKDVDCRRANLKGQEPQDWEGAQLQGAHFEDLKELNDRAWWLEKSPGHRLGLS